MWVLLLGIASCYFLGRVAVAIWYIAEEEENRIREFVQSKSLNEEEAKKLAKLTNPQRTSVVELMKTVRQAEFKTCKHAKYDDRGSCIPVCIKLPNIFTQPHDVIEEKVQILFTEQREGMLSRATYQHCVGTAVEAFMLHDFLQSLHFYLASYLLDEAITSSSIEQVVPQTLLEAKRIGNSEERLLQALQSQIPCKCLDLQDPSSEYFCLLQEDLTLAAKRRTTDSSVVCCHYCQQSNALKPCKGCKLVLYCGNSRCRQLDFQTHSLYCGKQPEWWGAHIEEEGNKKNI